jgi:hypothetical protein
MNKITASGWEGIYLLLQQQLDTLQVPATETFK